MIEYSSNIKLIEEAINQLRPGIALEYLILSLSANGKSKTEIYSFFTKYYLENNETKDYLKIEEKHGDHPIEIAMDCLWGYCRVEDRILPNESIDRTKL